MSKNRQRKGCCPKTWTGCYLYRRIVAVADFCLYIPLNIDGAFLLSIRLEDWHRHWNYEPPITGKPTCERCKSDVQVTWTGYIVVGCHWTLIIDISTLVKIDWDIFLKTASPKLYRVCRLLYLLSLPWISIRHASFIWFFDTNRENRSQDAAPTGPDKVIRSGACFACERDSLCQRL